MHHPITFHCIASCLIVPHGPPTPQLHLPTFTEAGSAGLPQLPSPSPASAKPSVNIPAMHTIPLQLIDSLEASTHQIDWLFTEMDQILQKCSKAMQQLFDQLHFFLQNSSIVPMPNHLVKCHDYPSSLNHTYLNASGNYNPPANRVPWFWFSLFSLLSFSSCNSNQQYLYTMGSVAFSTGLLVQSFGWQCMMVLQLSSRDPQQPLFSWQRATKISPLHAANGLPDTHIHTSIVVSSLSAVSHNPLAMSPTALFQISQTVLQLQCTPTYSATNTDSTYQYQHSAHNNDYMAVLTCIPWYQPGLHSFRKSWIFGLVRPGHCIAPTQCPSIQPLLHKISSTTPMAAAVALSSTALPTSNVLIHFHQPLLTKTYYGPHNVYISVTTFQIVWVLDSCDKFCRTFG